MKKYSDEDILEEAQLMNEKNYTFQQVSDEMDIAHSTVGWHMLKSLLRIDIRVWKEVRGVVKLHKTRSRKKVA